MGVHGLSCVSVHGCEKVWEPLSYSVPSRACSQTYSVFYKDKHPVFSPFPTDRCSTTSSTPPKQLPQNVNPIHSLRQELPDNICNKTVAAPVKQTRRAVNLKYLLDAGGLRSAIYVDVGGLRGFQVLVHISAIIMHINKPHYAQHSCLHEERINYQIRVTSFIPYWGSESWNGKPGIPKRKQTLSLDELLMF